MLTLKNKRCEGYDRIPVCILADARENLYDPLAQLFSKMLHLAPDPATKNVSLSSFNIQWCCSYYYNCKTEVSQWEKPREWVEQERAARHHQATSPADTRGVVSASSRSSNSIKVRAAWPPCLGLHEPGPGFFLFLRLHRSELK